MAPSDIERPGDPEAGHGVEREQHRERDRRRDDEARPHVPEEQEEHRDDEERALEQVRLDGAQDEVHELRPLVDRLDLHAPGKPRLHLLEPRSRARS